MKYFIIFHLFVFICYVLFVFVLTGSNKFILKMSNRTWLLTTPGRAAGGSPRSGPRRRFFLGGPLTFRGN